MNANTIIPAFVIGVATHCFCKILDWAVKKIADYLHREKRS